MTSSVQSTFLGSGWILIVKLEILHPTPNLLPSQRRHIQQMIRDQENLDPTVGGGVGVEYLVTLSQKYANPEIPVS